MGLAQYLPSAALRPFVKVFNVVEFDSEHTSRLLPEAGLLLGIRYRGRAWHDDRRLPDAVLTGLRGTARRIVTSAGGGIVVASFHETGAAHFFPDPLHELFGAMPALDVIAGRRDVARVSQQVAEAADDLERVAAVERFLLARSSPAPIDALVTRAVAAIRSSRGQLRIAALARELRIGQDALEKRFRRVVGGSPKQLASIVRLQSAIASHQSGMSLTEAAIDAGFCDQSHFIRAFRAAANEAPRRFFGAQQ